MRQFHLAPFVEAVASTQPSPAIRCRSAMVSATAGLAGAPQWFDTAVGCFGGLESMKLRVHTAFRQELGMGASFGEFVVFDHQNHVRLLDGMH
jgi:hypothetical protein